MKSLEEVLAYRAPEVLLRFREEFHSTQEDTELLFTEMLRWLWACAKTKDRSLKITPELVPIDEMWHSFLMFTREYREFCQEYLGHMVDHNPISHAESTAFAELRAHDPEAARRQRQAEVRQQLEYLYELVGPETLKLWYQVLPEKFISCGISAQDRSR